MPQDLMYRLISPTRRISSTPHNEADIYVMTRVSGTPARPEKFYRIAEFFHNERHHENGRPSVCELAAASLTEENKAYVIVTPSFKIHEHSSSCRSRKQECAALVARERTWPSFTTIRPFNEQQPLLILVHMHAGAFIFCRDSYAICAPS